MREMRRREMVGDGGAEVARVLDWQEAAEVIAWTVAERCLPGRVELSGAVVIDG
jgi:hypothetical protein